MSSNIFGNSDKGGEDFKEKVDIHSKAIITAIQRQKDLESSVDLINEKIDMLDHNTIKSIRELSGEIKNLKSDSLELKGEIEKLKEFNKKISKQLKLMATKDEVEKLDKYIDLWNPMNFVTRDELKEAQQKTLKELKKIIEKFLKE